MLTSAEHASARRRAKDARNAYGRARRWCTRVGATVRRDPVPGGVLWTVHVPGFHPSYAVRLDWAVAQLEANVRHFCCSPTATNGPTGAKLDRLRGILGTDGE